MNRLDITAPATLTVLAGTGTLVSGSFDTSARIWKLAREGGPKVARQPDDGAPTTDPARK